MKDNVISEYFYKKYENLISKIMNGREKTWYYTHVYDNSDKMQPSLFLNGDYPFFEFAGRVNRIHIEYDGISEILYSIEHGISLNYDDFKDIYDRIYLYIRNYGIEYRHLINTNDFLFLTMFHNQKKFFEVVSQI